jgi:hypothetical protein
VTRILAAAAAVTVAVAAVTVDDSPGPLSRLGQACLSHDPADRPTSTDILEVLEPCQALPTQ